MGQTITERREIFHALRLNENLDPLNPALNSYIAQAQPGFLQQTGDPAAAQQMAWQSLENLREQQASALAYFDAFLIFAVLAVLLAFLVLLMKRSVAEKRRSSRRGVDTSTTSMNTHSDVSDRPPAPSNNSPGFKANAFVREGLLQRVAPVLLRWALAVTFLSAVADRFGLWGPPGTANVSWGDWSHFVAYTAKVNSFLPGIVAPALAVMATAAEALLGVALLLGVFPRPVAWATATLLALFAGAMILSFGIKAPLNYSVFVDAAAALVLSVWPAIPTFKSTLTRA